MIYKKKSKRPKERINSLADKSQNKKYTSTSHRKNPSALRAPSNEK
jgi:hypothetical protein